jgi:hypothetical protein
MSLGYVPNTTRWVGRQWFMSTLHRDVMFEHVVYLPTTENPWDRHLKSAGLQSSFYQLCEAFSLVFFNFRYHQNCTGNLAALFLSDMWEGTLNRHLLPHFRVVECFASVIQSGTFPRRQLNVATIGKREMLLESIVCVAGRQFTVELLLRLPRRWMVRFIMIHHVYLLLEAEDYENETRLINH